MCLFVCLFVCLSVCLFVCFSVICLSVCRCVCSSVFLFFLFVSLSISCLFLCLFVYLSISQRNIFFINQNYYKLNQTKRLLTKSLIHNTCLSVSLFVCLFVTYVCCLFFLLWTLIIVVCRVFSILSLFDFSVRCPVSRLAILFFCFATGLLV